MFIFVIINLKARIKAIIAQASLQAAASNGTNNLQLINDGFNIGSFQLNDERQMQQHSQHQSFNNLNQQQQNQLNFLKNSFMYQNSLLECLNKKLENTNSNATNNSASTTNNFFNTDQLIKFANNVDSEHQQKMQQIPQFEFSFDFSENPIENKERMNKSSSKNDEMLLNLVKKTISPIDSPQHDLSSSSDSGCRSASFIADCDDSAIVSTTSTVTYLSSEKPKSQAKNTKPADQFLSVDKSSLKQLNDEITLSEHLEFTCSNTSNKDAEKPKDVNSKDEANDDIDNYADERDDNDCDSDCDTSDDASEIPADECINDMDLIEYGDLNPYDYSDLNKYNQVVEKDGSVSRKKLQYGCIYRSVNQTMSLFIEPNDILKQMDPEEYDEYILFPNEDLESSFSYFDENMIVNGLNTELVESLHLVIKNRFYLWNDLWNIVKKNERI